MELRIAYAHCCFNMADDREEDGQPLDLDLYHKAESLLAALVGESPGNDDNRVALVYVEARTGRRAGGPRKARRRIDLAESLADEARTVTRKSATGSRGEYGRRLLAMDRLTPSTGMAPGELRRRRLAEGTIAMLCQAAAAGYKDIKRLRSEPAFEPVRSSAEYQAILRDIGFPAETIAGP